MLCWRISPAGRKQIFYDQYGNVSSITNAKGIVQSYSYDSENNMFCESISIIGGTETITSTIEYDYALQRKTREEDCNDNYFIYNYDSWGRLTELYTSYDTLIPAVSYEYHNPDNGRWWTLTKNKVSFDSADTKTIETVNIIDGLGRTEILGKTGLYYDMDTDTKKEGFNVNGAVVYDAKGRTVKQGMTYFIEGALSALLNTEPVMSEYYTTFTYDALDRTVKTVLPDSSVSSISYLIENNRAVTESTDDLGNIVKTEKDTQGNIRAVKHYDKNRVMLTHATYDYDVMGQILTVTDAQGHRITSEYDLLGRRTALQSADFGRREYTFTVTGQLESEDSSVLRAKGEKILYEYDSLDRLIRVNYPQTEDTLYTYGTVSDKAIGGYNKVIKQEDSSGITEYEYGRLGEVTSETKSMYRLSNAHNDELLTYETKYRSNYLGQMEELTYPDGEVVSYSYDIAGQVIGITGYHYGETQVYVADIGYDEYGQRTYIILGNNIRTDYEYDSQRRWLACIKTESTIDFNQVFQNIEYSFDTVGNVTGYTNDCLTSVTGNYKTEQNYTYDSLYQLIRAEGQSEYSEKWNMTQYRPSFTSSYSQEFAYDNIGDLILKESKETDTSAHTTGIGDDLNYKFEYDYSDYYAHRINKVGGRYYGYDENGNITVERNGEYNNGYVYENVKVGTSNDGRDIYRLNWAIGLEEQPKRSTDTVYQKTYEYDERDRLTHAVDNFQLNSVYKYDESGNRSHKYNYFNEEETLYANRYYSTSLNSFNKVYDGQSIKHIFLNNERLVTKTALNKINGTERAYSDYEITHTYYYHTDHLGSATLITDYRGKEYQRIEYTPYGESWIELTKNTGENYLPYKFTGKELDEETGLYYYGQRYLDPKYSIWHTSDPAIYDYMSQSKEGEGGIYNITNLNLYHYAGNNPVKYVDPDGRVTDLNGKGTTNVYFIYVYTGSENDQQMKAYERGTIDDDVEYLRKNGLVVTVIENGTKKDLCDAFQNSQVEMIVTSGHGFNASSIQTSDNGTFSSDDLKDLNISDVLKTVIFENCYQGDYIDIWKNVIGDKTNIIGWNGTTSVLETILFNGGNGYEDSSFYKAYKDYDFRQEHNLRFYCEQLTNTDN